MALGKDANPRGFWLGVSVTCFIFGALTISQTPPLAVVAWIAAVVFLIRSNVDSWSDLKGERFG